MFRLIQALRPARTVKAGSLRIYTPRIPVRSISFLSESPKPGKQPKEKPQFFRIEFQRQNNGGKGPNSDPEPPNWKQIFFWGLGSSLVLTLLWQSYRGMGGQEMSWQEFRAQYLDKHLVEKIVLVNRTHGRALLKEGYNPRLIEFSVGSVDTFDRSLDEAQAGVPDEQRVPVIYINETSAGSMVMAILPTLLLIGGLWFLVRRGMAGAGSGGIFNMGKSTAKRFNQDMDVKVKFKDVAGCDEAKAEILEFVSFLKEPAKYENLGAKIPRGAILSGPPGTGKTLLAKATAGEAGVPFFSVSGSEFVEMFVGVGASRVRDLFATARKEAPSIVFIDEIDAIGRARSAGGNFGGGHDEREATLNQVLVEMDGFSTSDHVVVLAGTNRPDVLDKALMRPGRFSRHITVDKPDVGGRHDIYMVYLKKIKTDLDLEKLAQKLAALTPGFAGADIANCVNEAALIAARGDATEVEWKHFEAAVERTSFGMEKKSKVLTPEERKTIAYHEAGHAVCGWYLEHTDPFLKATIIPRGNSLGHAKYLPADIPLPNNKELEDRMVMALGGRVAEELHFDSTSSGASSDFEKVTQIATNMVVQWGMSPKIGYVNYDEPEGYYTKPYSEHTASEIDAEVKRIVDKAYKRCQELLTEKATQVKTIAEGLLEKETLERSDFIKLIGPRPFKDNTPEFKYLMGEGVVSDDAKPEHDQKKDKNGRNDTNEKEDSDDSSEKK